MKYVLGFVGWGNVGVGCKAQQQQQRRRSWELSSAVFRHPQPSTNRGRKRHVDL
jgi:hypothetical protein